MGDPTPLLSQPNNTSDTKTSPNKHLHSLGFTIEKCIGELNWSQFFQAVLISFAWIFDAQQTFITVFTDAVPSWHCTGENIDILNGCYSTPSFNDVCKFPKGSWAWDGPPQASIISEWAMQCESSIITGLPASMFFMGCLVGGTFLSTLADSSSLGRKNMLFFSTLLMALSSFFTAFSPNIWIYSLLKFLSGFGRATIGTSSLVLASELVGKRWRALSMARLAVVFGGAFSPLLVGAGRGNKFLCYGVFGLAIGFSGVFGVFLPETKGRVLCDTMDEEENKDKISCEILV